MSHITPDTFAAVTSQVLGFEFTAYTPKPGHDMLALAEYGSFVGGKHLIQFALFNETLHRVTLTVDMVEFDNEVQDTDTLSVALVAACRRIESALAALIAA